MTFFAFSLYFRLLSTSYSTFCTIDQLSIFRCISITDISKNNFFLTLPERCRYGSKLFFQNIHIFFLLFNKGAGMPYRSVPSQKTLHVSIKMCLKSLL